MAEVITIDGPTSSGKNSVGFLLAQKLGYQYIDTGMIYRAGCYCMLKNDILSDDEEKVLDCYRNLKMEFKVEDGKHLVYLDGEGVTNKLHTPEISRLVPVVAAKPKVRAILRGVQRRIGISENTVMSGRDIGTEIFPSANHKFYLTASAKVRAQRRYNQLVKQNRQIKYKDVLDDMIERDRQDMEREVSPLKIPEGAVVIDNFHMNVGQTVDKMLQIIKGKL